MDMEDLAERALLDAGVEIDMPLGAEMSSAQLHQSVGEPYYAIIDMLDQALVDATVNPSAEMLVELRSELLSIALEQDRAGISAALDELERTSDSDCD